MRAVEADMVQAEPVLTERVVAGRLAGVLVKADEGATRQHPHDVPPRPGVLVERGLRAEQGGVPRLAGVSTSHCYSDVPQWREIGHVCSAR